MKRSQKSGGQFKSKIYPPGSEYTLAYAMALLMSALVSLLSENLTESIKGFYKLRKAYLTLHNLVEIETRLKRERRGLSNPSVATQDRRKAGGFDAEKSAGGIVSSRSSVKGQDGKENGFDPKQDVKEMTGKVSTLNIEDESDLESIKANEGHSREELHNSLSHISTNDTLKNGKPASINSTTSLRSPVAPSIRSNTSKFSNDAEEDDVLFTNPVDVFVHSGSNMCYGLLLLVLSMIPPAFNRLLSIIGFKGDRERGLKLLWGSTRYANICGAIAGLILLAYYNGLVGLCDIHIDTVKFPDDLTGYPKARCEALLAQMRSRYTESRLWRLQEALILSGNRQPRQALEILENNLDSRMKQIAAMNMFELSLTCLYLHKYDSAATSFASCIKLNNWSHALYYFNIGGAYVELYRESKKDDPAAAKVWKQKATEAFRQAPAHAGKKKLMAKQLPFDVFVIRKIQKWEERAKLWNVDFIDAIGVSPSEEMIYLWNGYKRMGPAELQISLAKLDWQRTSHPAKHRADLDETAISSLLKSTVLRNLGRLDEATAVLKDEILCHDKYDFDLFSPNPSPLSTPSRDSSANRTSFLPHRSLFKGDLRDDWSYPSAIYEMAAIAWFRKDMAGEQHDTRVLECENWLHRVAHWEAYTLDGRIGLKITTALDTVRRYKTMAVVA